jgi:transcriptional regulator with XRE-family HTH domain
MSNKIAELRKSQGVTQRKLAIAFDVTDDTIKHWESRAIATIWIERVIKLCEIFNCEPKDLLKRSPNENINLD